MAVIATHAEGAQLCIPTRGAGHETLEIKSYSVSSVPSVFLCFRSYNIRVRHRAQTKRPHPTIWSGVASYLVSPRGDMPSKDASAASSDSGRCGGDTPAGPVIKPNG